MALIGLHVVGLTDNHPEFLWGTFEHKMNSPVTADNTFTPSPTVSDPNTYTLYKANTLFSQVNAAFDPPDLKLDAATQKFTPVTNVVLENQTGGENQTDGVGNIFAINSSAQNAVAAFSRPRCPPNRSLPTTTWSERYGWRPTAIT